jgi:hypothetical protein
MKDLFWKDILQISAQYFDFSMKLIFCDSANLSNSQNPKLCLELEYCVPGFPNPIMAVQDT